jgi:hypothetical protein
MVGNYIHLMQQGIADPSHSMANGGGKGGGSAPAPDYGPMAAASAEAARLGKELGDATLAENKRQYELNMATLKPVIDESIRSQQIANQQGVQNYNTFQAEGRPVQQSMMYDAMGLNSNEIGQYNTLRAQETAAARTAMEANMAKLRETLGNINVASLSDAEKSEMASLLTPQYQTNKQTINQLGMYNAGESGTQWTNTPVDINTQSAIPLTEAQQKRLKELVTKQSGGVNVDLGNQLDNLYREDNSGSSSYMAQVAAASKQRQMDEAAGTAVADARAGTNQQMNQLIRQGLRMGWSPAKLAAMGGQAATMGAQGQVAAANQARNQADAKRTAKLGDVYNTYAGLGSSAPSFYNAATGAANQASGSQLGMSGQMMNGMAQGNATTMQGQNAKINGLGSILQSQTSAYNASLQSNQSDPLGGILGMGAQLGGAAIMKYSDSRLKENVSYVGQSHNGFNLYEFNYIATPDERFRGVMAQEVMEVMPEAVVETSDGYLAVRYDMIGVNMEKVN